jgi:predicted nucleic acid-binding protein
MTGLLDTTVLVDLTRGSVEAAQFLDREFTSGDPPLISIVSAMELLVGCRDQLEVERMQKTLSGFAIIQLTPAISQQAYGLIAQYGRSHGLVIPDALIAATAMVEGLPLVTHNDRHFQMINGLELQRPY